MRLARWVRFERVVSGPISPIFGHWVSQSDTVLTGGVCFASINLFQTQVSCICPRQPAILG
jgi:hypothetical protein